MRAVGNVQRRLRADAPFAYRTGELVLIAVQTESRIVPPAVVNERLAAKVKEIEEKEGELQVAAHESA
jgi:DNA recombination-dependent growth factor C